MPKIIENLPQRLMEEARRQVKETGYASLTIRSIAQNCGVGVGTVYNYYRSKDELVASFMLKDWRECMSGVYACSETAEEPEPVLRAIHNGLTLFITRNRMIFRDREAAVAFAGSTGRHHAMLRAQLAAPLRRFCADDFTADFVAEAVLTWTVAEVPFEKMYELVRKLL